MRRVRGLRRPTVSADVAFAPGAARGIALAVAVTALAATKVTDNNPCLVLRAVQRMDSGWLALTVEGLRTTHEEVVVVDDLTVTMKDSEVLATTGALPAARSKSSGWTRSGMAAQAPSHAPRVYARRFTQR
jgi:hypothetical protein